MVSPVGSAAQAVLNQFSVREPAGQCPFVDQHEKRATKEEGKEAGRISLLSISARFQDHIKLPKNLFSCNQNATNPCSWYSAHLLAVDA